MSDNEPLASPNLERKLMSSRQAAAVAEYASFGRGLDHEPDEQELFVAMHSCAKLNETARHRKKDAVSCWEARRRAIRDYIVEKNMGLAYSVVHRVGSRKVNEDDLLSDAMFALARAVDQFNPWKGYRFSTYACTVIARDLMRRGKRESSYRRLFPVQHDATMERPSRRVDTGTELYVERLQLALDSNLGQLTDLEARILAERFPTDAESRLTFLEIGDMVGLSKERVRQIQNIALQKLRRVLGEDPVLRHAC